MDLKNLTYKQKYFYLLGGSAVFLVLIYFFALSKTFELASNSENLENKLLAAKEAPLQLKELETRFSRINNSFSNFKLDSNSRRNEILSVVSSFCYKNNIMLQQLPFSESEHREDFKIETNVIVAQGDFIDLLKLLHHLEHKNKISKVSSVDFSSFIDRKRKKTVLQLTMYLQNIQLKKKTDL